MLGQYAFAGMKQELLFIVLMHLKKVNPTIQGLQDSVLGPVGQFSKVINPFVQILHTGRYHWVCISSVGCSNGIVNLYDSLYHNVISKEVEEQAINLVGTDSFSRLNVVPAQQRNGSDWCICCCICDSFGSWCSPYKIRQCMWYTT